jgi:hypothetical protein
MRATMNRWQGNRVLDADPMPVVADTGGGDLTADRTISVPKATKAQAQAAIDDTTALTPARGLDLIKAQAVAILKAARDTLPTSPAGLASGEPCIDGNFIQFAP